jgi:hypothetical protein
VFTELYKIIRIEISLAKLTLSSRTYHVFCKYKIWFKNISNVSIYRPYENYSINPLTIVCWNSNKLTFNNFFSRKTYALMFMMNDSGIFNVYCNSNTNFKNVLYHLIIISLYANFRRKKIQEIRKYINI